MTSIIILRYFKDFLLFLDEFLTKIHKNENKRNPLSYNHFNVVEVAKRNPFTENQ